MARILYGVSGEGSGHSSRSREVVSHLQSRGHEVKIVTYGRGYENLRSDFDVDKIFGLHFDYRNNEVRYLSTVFKNVLKTPAAVKSVEKVDKICDELKPQIVFSDFEPISCLVANAKKIPLVSIDNQHRLTNTRIKYPKKYAVDAAMAKAVTNMMIFGSQACLVTTFSPDPVINKKTFIFPPILRRAVLETNPSDKGHILVYLTSKYGSLLDILGEINANFIVYGLDQHKKIGNIVLKKAGQDEFLRDLAGCSGVIANAGFTLITEALHLGKPYLALPLLHQFEQILNALELEKLGYGKHWDELNQERIEAFLFNLKKYRKKLESYPRNDNSKIMEKIDELILKNSQ